MKPASTAVRTPTYFGGKSHLNHGSGRWVASMLPQDLDVTYCEPCCGLAKILIQRRPATVEILNDINDRIANYLTVVRDHPEELAWRSEYTAISESDFRRAVAEIDTHADPIERARFLYVILNFSLLHGDGARPTFAVDWGRDGGRGRERIHYDHVIRLGARIAKVQILCRDGIDVIESLASNAGAVIYVDPPYRSSNTSVYRHGDMDWERLGEAMAACKGRVAVSGYGDEWDSLGWQRYEYQTTVTGGHIARMRADNSTPARTEVLWTNYEPDQRRLL